MKTCKWCNASGWIRGLSDNGLCRECNLQIVNRVQIHARIIRRILGDIQQTRSIDTMIGMARRLEKEAQTLQEFEDCGIRTITPRPSQLAERYADYRRALQSARDAHRDLQEETPPVERPEFTSVSIVDTMDPLGTWSADVTV